MDFQQKKTIKRIMYSKITLFVLLLLVILFTRAVWNMYQKEKFSKIGLATVEKKYDDLTSRKEYLEGQIDKLQTDEGVEAEIRDKFSVTKRGEVSVLIIDSSSSDKQMETVENKSLWQKFLGFFTQ